MNDTSLALALELPDGRTLIFTGDATRVSRSWKEFRNRVIFDVEFPADAQKKAGEPLYVEYTIPL